MKKLRKDKGGFTLVELMIVVVILGILVAIAVPIFSAVTAKAHEKTCKNNMETIEKTATQFMMDGTADTCYGIFAANAGGATTTQSVTFSTPEEAKTLFSVAYLKFFDGGQPPVCKDHTYTVTIDADSGNRSVIVTCSEHGTRKS